MIEVSLYRRFSYPIDADSWLFLALQHDRDKIGNRFLPIKLEAVT
ncbi:hypothetical protein [Virgibacillus pantothenticus]|nr:hypothetical protein [Virgibacillus pantothenticus]